MAAHWSLVRSVHVEDFLGCGTEQLLLVFEEEEEDGTGRPFERFLLTDLCGISLSVRSQVIMWHHVTLSVCTGDVCVFGLRLVSCVFPL